VTGTVFSGNSADGGGGVCNDGGAAAIEACAFFDNFAYLGGAIYNLGAAPLVASCSFYGNTANYSGAAICSRDGSAPAITNCVAWENDPEEAPVYDYDSASISTVTYSDIQGGCAVATGCTTDETGDVDSDPLFLDPAAGDLRLLPGSPCIDAADADAAPPLDLDGNPRVDDPGTPDTGAGAFTYADMGAYEFQP
jgi:hypothetical protein